ncbi:unnamed protein product [marine sediment metagenome]|uniref:Uncharacterized protein n=1 Tax=marine sediment metagenome TaxID=412755 RepID=X1A7D5_9ZZZZ
MGLLGKFLLTEKLINEKLTFTNSIPIFPGPDPWPRPGMSRCGYGK